MLDRMLQVYEIETVLVWNPAVANLSLMALGSSTPEILLGVYETLVKNNLFSGDLGPGTIVGSAAFNLFVITAMCMVALPDGETRKIENLQVYFLTASHSMLVYIWLFIILAVWTPNVVTIAEAVITLMMMPWLIVLVWLADNHWFGFFEGKAGADGKVADDGGVPHDEEAGMGRAASADSRSESGFSRRRSSILMKQNNERYFDARKNALRHFMGSKKAKEVESDDREKLEEQQALLEAENEQDFPVIQFPTAQFSFLETVGNAKLSIMRQGKLDCVAKVNYETVDGSAKEGKAYEAAHGTLVFEPNEVVKHVYVAIIHDDVWTEDKAFSLMLSPGHEEGDQVVKLGKMNRAEITIIDMDSPGIFCWVETATQDFLSTDSNAYLVVERRKGCTGEVKIKVKTEGDTAKPGVHYKDEERELIFADGEASKTVKIKLLPFKKPDEDEAKPIFTVKLETSGEKGGAEISSEAGSISVRLTYNGSVEGEEEELITWPEQFRQSLSVGGGEDMEDAGCIELFMHYLSITWKLAAAMVPPPHMGGGVPCFFTALVFVGVITAFIGDIAAIFGCLVGLKDAVTAITLVALGTSLPDTFASIISIQQDDNADNAIGNVTGSNAVNVFLGLGLPYTISAIYWSMKDPKSDKDPQIMKWQALYENGGNEDGKSTLYNTYFKPIDDGGQGQVPFVVIAGNLGFNVLIFCILAGFAIFFLSFRRATIGCELGGPSWSNKASCAIFVTLWVVYILLSAFQEYHPTYFMDTAPPL